MREGAKRADALWEFWDCIIGSISIGGGCRFWVGKIWWGRRGVNNCKVEYTSYLTLGSCHDGEK